MTFKEAEGSQPRERNLLLSEEISRPLVCFPGHAPARAARGDRPENMAPRVYFCALLALVSFVAVPAPSSAFVVPPAPVSQCTRSTVGRAALAAWPIAGAWGGLLHRRAIHRGGCDVATVRMSAAWGGDLAPEAAAAAEMVPTRPGAKQSHIPHWALWD